ncbi:Anthranilate 1,2-dioxygenase system ferredoxin--NAD(+) reductase component [Corynebacterium occultum]|uniref:Anthranilate 1,2-dioxygenase system ferredoxin--NAD(+) reductase component n=1 Tax=Corynebacterium occultum TaxID=2675219 RepID=A0A6B8VUT0_9CORY|nr:FAD-dependent oxidoreductase [Corynebacterium occultum]QGU06839.1 Anthranilate 1,2-dioxygenase system ferredoxin--NAD(+) reductase component [Corynebacterium occultum]
MSSSTTILGGGIGGFTLAQELRKLGYEGAVTIIDEHGLPYDRPPLSKEILSGTKAPEEIQFVPESWYSENQVKVLQAKVERIDAAARTLLLDNGEEHTYDNLVLATGGHARRGDTPGFNDDSVIVLRTLADAQRLSENLVAGRTLGIIGAGLIGAEVASVARERGAEVILVDPAPVSLIPAVGEEIAQRLHDLHDAHGVHFINGLTSAIRREGEKYLLEIDGQDETVEVDAVLLCIGLVPEESLAASAGLERDGGVLVDAEQRTSAPGIWAVGDCARRRNADGSLERRHEHWESAMQEAKTAAASITGSPAPVGGASWFWSDRYGVHLEGIGSMTAVGSTVIRPDEAGHPAVAFRVTPEGKLAGAASYNDSMAVRAARRIIDRELDVDPAKLADPTIPLKKLTR